MNFKEEYRKKLISAEAAAGMVRSGMWIDYGSILSFPSLIDENLAKRARDLEKVKVRSCLSLRDPEILKADRKGEHFIYNEWGMCLSLPESIMTTVAALIFPIILMKAPDSFAIIIPIGRI